MANSSREVYLSLLAESQGSPSCTFPFALNLRL
ncbi:protein CHLOROPLAST ENHANCING STRESS TOLERANCE, chloroplastic [Iris pallida]|uniref:Protein CHLOROPLAST ENHANCING STRESS TOLERANCE, chloroplastic n=1 Tax=Iris pallida TaxID=29817 RepID=A0AAX6DK00_IRIPA|nr:protein CHLOROPLAST ENHANCING STRESS TOLERANCE, chloroplastic [Iris pallida]